MKINTKKLFDIFNYLIMVLVIISTLYPFYYVAVASISDPTALSTFTGVLLKPLAPITTKAYEAVFNMPLLISGYLNTIKILVVGVSVNMVLTILGAYFLSIEGPRHKNFIAFMIIFTMYFSGGMIPSFLNVKDLGLYDTFWALVIPGAINTTYLIIMKSAFQSVPASLMEAAELDGASYIQILVKVMLPVVKPTIAVLVLYYGVDHWNEWFNASIYLQSKELFPIQLVLRNLLASTDSIQGMEDMAAYVDLIKYALIMVTTVPIICIYPFLQKYFAKGVMVGAVKG